MIRRSGISINWKRTIQSGGEIEVWRDNVKAREEVEQE
jgi:hypothetical protein